MKYFGIEKIEDPQGVKRMYKELVARGTRRLNEMGLSPDGDAGDVSIRDPETGYIYVSGSPKMRPNSYRNLSEYRDSDMAVVDADGNYIVPWAGATCELPMHLAIMKARPDINCIVHTHAIWSSAWAICGKNIPLVIVEQHEHLGGEIVCAPFEPVGSDAVGAAVVKALGKHKYAALMGSHGAVAIGIDLDDAFNNAIFLEAIAEKAWLSYKLGNMRVVKPEDLYDPSIQDELLHPLTDED